MSSCKRMRACLLPVRVLSLRGAVLSATTCDNRRMTRDVAGGQTKDERDNRQQGESEGGHDNSSGRQTLQCVFAAASDRRASGTARRMRGHQEPSRAIRCCREISESHTERRRGGGKLATHRCLAGHARQRLTHVLPGIYAGRERQDSSTCHVPGHLLTHSPSSCAVFLEQTGLDIILYALKADIVAHRCLLIIGDRNRAAVLEHAHHRECIR